MSTKEIRFGISRTKAILQLTAALVVCGAVGWFVIKVLALPPAFNRTFLLICCTFLLLAFGLLCISGIIKLANLSQGIIVNEKGIGINFRPNSGQFINWEEMTGVDISTPYQGPRTLVVNLKKSDDFISKTHGLKKLLLKVTRTSRGTSVRIPLNWLEYDFEELIGLINKNYNEYGAQHSV